MISSRGTVARSIHTLSLCRIAAIAAVVAATPAGAVTVEATAAVVSDYRFRGVSLSDRQPVADGTIEASAGPWFAAAEAISASHGRRPDLAARGDAEIDVSGGWSRSLGLLTPAAGVIVYSHPGGGATDAEAFASLAGALGPATLTVGANYAPDQPAVRGGNLYVFARASAGVPATPLTLHVAVGREAGGFAGGRPKVDYAGGVEARVWRRLTLGLDYVGNDSPPTSLVRLQRNRADAVVVRAGVHF